jgi:hypothetical protein
VQVERIGAHTLRLTFSDRLVRELDFSETLRRGVFAPLEDEMVFAQARIDAVTGTVCWPNGADLDPDVLHGDFEPASGRGSVVVAGVPPPSDRLT